MIVKQGRSEIERAKVFYVQKEYEELKNAISDMERLNSLLK